MTCRGIFKYGLEIPNCFTEDNIVMQRKVTCCILKNCPKSKDKFDITKRCYSITDTNYE